MNFCFVTTRRGSPFMTELLSAVSAATESAGHNTELAFDSFPAREQQCTYVVIPHEFHAWGDPHGFPDRSQRARTIALCTENPGTEWFEATYRLLPELAAAVSINRSSAAELCRRGVRCEHVQLGYSPQWDSWGGDANAHRPIDALYLGAADPRRDPLLAELGARLWARECELLIPPLEPRTKPRPDFITGANKYRRLGASKILLNLHRTTSAALEWMRFLEAICNGCVVVSEPCLDPEPLVPGVHFLVSDVDRIAVVVDRLLDDSAELRVIRDRAYEFVRRELPMEPVGERLAELAAELPREPASVKPALLSVEHAQADAAQASSNDRPPAPAPSPARVTRRLAGPGARPRASLVARLSRRSLGHVPLLARHRRRVATDVLAATTSYSETAPMVSVLVDGRARSVASLATVADSLTATLEPTGELELLLLAGAPASHSQPAYDRPLDQRSELATILLRQKAQGGRGAALNALTERARGEYVFVLDLDGGIYPSTLGRLLRALEADRDAIFAFSMSAGLEGDRAVRLLGSLPWEPERLRQGNWIGDAALIRRRRLVQLGGYCTDARLAGWEEYELWCKCAEAGGHGAHVPQVLAWTRGAISTGTPQMWALMRARFPDLLGWENDRREP